MRRIGIAASKMAKGNLFLYNGYVVLISFLFSLFIFVVAGCTVVFALLIIHYVAEELMAVEFEKSWPSVLSICMVSLTILAALFNLIAILKNIKLSKGKK